VSPFSLVGLLAYQSADEILSSCISFSGIIITLYVRPLKIVSMKISVSLLTIIASIFFIPSVFTSCSKNNSSDRGQASFRVFLTDDPADFESVFIDIQDVQVNLTGNGDNGWQSLQGVNKGVYDLLTLVDNHDTLLADATIPSGRVYQLRLILGTENYVKVNGTMIALNTLADQQSGLKLKIQQYVTSGTSFKVILDFDVAKSIVFVDSSSYNLKPAIRTVFEFVGGNVRGWVSPKDFQTIVYAIQEADTVASTFTGQEGGYIIKGIAEGPYSLYFNPADTTHKDSLITGINVINKEETIIDTIFLRQ